MVSKGPLDFKFGFRYEIPAHIRKHLSENVKKKWLRYFYIKKSRTNINYLIRHVCTPQVVLIFVEADDETNSKTRVYLIVIM